MSEVLPSGWAFGNVPELAEILDSKRVPLNAEERAVKLQGAAVDTLVPYYGATGQVGLTVGHLFDEELVLLGEDGVPFLDPLKKKAYRISGRSWVNNHAHVLRARQGACDARFLEAHLNSISYVGHVTGSTRLKLTQAAMNAMQLRVAPYAEQCRIADKLDTVLARVDGVKARLDRVAPLLKRFRQSVLAAATSGRLTEEWREFHGPQEWLSTAIGDIAIHISDGPFGSNLKSDDYTEAGARVVRLENIGHLAFHGDKKTYVSMEKYQFLQKHTLQPGDLLFSSFVDEEVRVCEFPAGLMTPAINKADCFCVRLDAGQVHPQFVMMRLASRSTYETLKDSVHGATRPRINLKQLRALQIQLPGRQEQDEIVRRVKLLFGYADRLEARLQAAQTAADRLTPALLAKAFRGELVPQDPNDEPASELLKRLAAARDTSASPRRGRGRKASATIG